MLPHLRALQDIADASGGQRAAGSIGYDRSVDYVEAILEQSGYGVIRQEFPMVVFANTNPSQLRQVSSEGRAELAHTVMDYSGSGNVTAHVSIPTGSALGCSPEDFSSINGRTIVLLARGTCGLGTKSLNAFNAGAVGVVLYNNRPLLLHGTLLPSFTPDIPVVGVSKQVGEELRAQVGDGISLQLQAATRRTDGTSVNLLAESYAGDPGNVVVVGAHLDSVSIGPGANDNGSSVAALLEIARHVTQVRVRNRLRFAFWGAEEAGLIGSTYHVEHLAPDERSRVSLYLNFDMLASPNYARFVRDGSNLAFPAGNGVQVGPPGSGAIERLFQDYFDASGLANTASPFTASSDHAAFIAEGVEIPSGGVFTGGDEIKTLEQAAAVGGIAGEVYDACYHQACDTIDNINTQALDEMADAAAHSVATFAIDTSSLRPTSGSAKDASGEQ